MIWDGVAVSAELWPLKEKQYWPTGSCALILGTGAWCRSCLTPMYRIHCKFFSEYLLQTSNDCWHLRSPLFARSSIVTVVILSIGSKTYYAFFAAAEGETTVIGGVHYLRTFSLDFTIISQIWQVVVGWSGPQIPMASCTTGCWPSRPWRQHYLSLPSVQGLELRPLILNILPYFGIQTPAGALLLHILTKF